MKRRQNDTLDQIVLLVILIIFIVALTAAASRAVGASEPDPNQIRPTMTEAEIARQSDETVAIDNFIEPDEKNAQTADFRANPGIPEGIDPEDRDLVERIVMAEAGAEPYPGVIAVAQVILDQCREWGISVRETCTMPGRFTDPYQSDVSDRVKTAVHEVFDLGVRVTDEPITHFHNPTVDPYWAHTLTFVVRIGDHLFYR